MCSAAPIIWRRPVPSPTGVDKARRRRRGNERELGQAFRRIESKGRAMEGALNAWLLRFARAAASQETKRLLQSPGLVAKAVASDASLEAELRRIMETFGVRQLNSAANRAGALAGQGRVILPASAVDSFLADKDVRLQRIIESTRTDVRNSVRDLIRASLQETPQPSAGEIARRIRTQFHGQVAAGGRKTGTAEEPLDSSVLPTTTQSTEQGILYAFSSERAALIARTEIGIAENTGIARGYEALGVKRMMWLAFSGDFDRRHDEMNGKIRDISGGILEDRDSWFTLRDGTRMPYPLWDGAPIKHLANCRCSSRPMRN